MSEPRRLRSGRPEPGGLPVRLAPASGWVRPAGRDEPPPFGQALGWLGPESIDWRVLDQTEIWVDAEFRAHRLEQMPIDYLLNVVGFINGWTPLLDFHAAESEYCLWVRRPVVDSPLWQRMHAVLADRVRPAP